MAEETKDFGEQLFPVPPKVREKAYIKSKEEYQKLYDESVKDPDKFWAKIAERIDWFKKPTKICDFSFKPPVYVKWFEDGELNVSYNCLDRQIKNGRKNKAAIIFEGNDPSDNKTYTYMDMYREVNKFANVLKKHGIKRGDRVTIFLPMIPELAIAMLACTRIGAIHCIVFGGFSSDALKERIVDSESKLLITCDGTFRGAKAVPQKDNADKALAECPNVSRQIVVKRTGTQCAWKEGRDLWWEDEMKTVPYYCEPEKMKAEDPLFILYTSGSTGKPKGVMHTTGGYLVYVSYTHQLIFDYHEEDIYWCTADIGWVTGHSYIVYGPLANGATSIMFEGVPSYPGFDRFWDVVEKFKVDIFYTAPTAIRAIAKEGDDWVKKHDVSSIRILGSVGEPLNPEAWRWYYNMIGRGECTIVDTWWQTETGGILITPLPGA
ncbi:MAG TPA: acetate--CoA ligase, partial [Deltaproteobacteria bacterium]|nr:acetate--CoA ligase [Deltaproteobacteria bacterium]